LPQDDLRVPVERLARLGRRHAARGANQQPLPNLRLQGSDLLTERGLGDVQRVSRLGDAADIHDLREISEAGEVHGESCHQEIRQSRSRRPTQSGFFCFRATEAMMQSLKHASNENDGVGWKRLRSALRVERSVLEFLKDHADWARHGRAGVITDSTRTQLFELTDVIISRYLEFLMRGKIELPEAEFPPLTGPVS
jgi:hypothetical protein